MKIPYHILTLSVIAILGLVVLTSTANTIIIPTEEEINEEEINELLEAVYNDISTYIKIDRVIGKYEISDNNHVLSRIVIQIHLLFTKDIHIHDMVVELSDGDNLRQFIFSNRCDSLINYSLFSHPMFREISPNSFGVISIIDKDNSLKNHRLINHHSDRLFIIMNITDDIIIESGESFTLTVQPSVGTIRTITIEAPFSTQPIVDLLK